MTPDIEDAIRALRIAENHFDEAAPEYRDSAAKRLTAAADDFNTAFARAKAREGYAVTGARTRGGVRLYRALMESRQFDRLA